ncbi:hypothetical protein Zmor_024405 [Zophobas morio]|uniref:SOCS box domain-containing protein n=1 Tax=Zophobas morio TaxID=2755281 RepID=A0AA38M7N8_9CUCU|nr:hypothetical protein Zmor_024405 [Zophobas morio]
MESFQNKILPVQSCQLVEDLTTAIKNNDVYYFTKFFSKSLNREKNEGGFTLLQEAIRHNRRDIFDYLLQLQDKDDLEIRNTSGETPLKYAINHFREENDYFSLVLIEKGASLEVDDWSTAYLDRLVHASSRLTKLLLLDKGIDVNINDRHGTTPLLQFLCCGAHLFDKFGYNAFEPAVEYKQTDFVQELLFLYTFDVHLPCDIMFKTLLILAKQKSPLFHKIFEHDVEFLFATEMKKADFAKLLYILLDTEDNYFELVLDKCDPMVCEIFEKLVFYKSTPWPRSCIGCYRKYYYERLFGKNLTLKKLILLHERSQTISQCVVEFISILRNRELFSCISRTNNESTTTEFFIYLILHGLKINSRLFKIVFDKYGYCELFRLLLHVGTDDDVKEDTVSLRPPNRVPLVPVSDYYPNTLMNFICDVVSNVDIIPEKFKYADNNDLLDYFACPNLHKLMSILPKSKKVSDDILERIKNHPRVPLLVEISRDAFRKHFINKLNIKTTKQFYSLLNGLPISTTHKKIITFETKLYHS